MIRVPCACGRVLRAGDHLAGKKARCPSCGVVLAVPASGADAPPAAAPGSTLHCARHPEQRVFSKCQTCGKPICRECRSQYGYFCTALCRDRSRATKRSAPPEATPVTAETVHRAERVGKIVKRSLLIGVPVVLLAVGGLITLRHRGHSVKVLWQAPLGVSASGMAFHGGRVCVLDDRSRILAFDPATGGSVGAITLRTEVVSVETERGSFTREIGRLYRYGEPLEDPVLLRLLGDRIQAVGVAEAKELWTRPVEGGSFLETAQDALRVYAIFHRESDAPPKLAAYGVKDGAPLWEVEAEGGSIRPAGDIVLLVESGYGAEPSTVSAHDAAGGRSLWRASIPGAILGSAVPVAAGILLRVETHVVCLDRAAGTSKWQVPVSGGGYFARLYLSGAGDRLLIPAEDTVVCIDASSGTRRWETRVGGAIGDLLVVGEWVLASGTGAAQPMDLRESLGRRPGVDVVQEAMREQMPGSLTRPGKPFVAALKLGDGSVAWGGELGGSLLSDGNVLLVSTEQPRVQLATEDFGREFTSQSVLNAYGLEDGKPRWSYTPEGWSISDTILVGDRAILLESRPVGEAMPHVARDWESRLVALRLR